MSDRFEQGYACVIGIGGDLPSTVGDAKGLAKILKDPERCAYPNNQVKLLTGEEATRSNIMTALKTLANTTNAESTVLIYFSGHGHQLIKPLKSYYLMPHGYNTEDLPETAISGGEFTDLLREIPAQKLLVVLDCCHAGGLSDLSSFQVTKAPLPPEAQRMFTKGGGRIMIGSSRPNELSYAGEPYSAFTYTLIKGLCGAGAVKQDGYIRATDLAMYASNIVPKLTDDKQHPVLDIDKADNFILAYYAGGQLQPKGLPSELEDQPKIESKPGQLNGYSQHLEASGKGAVAVGGSANGATIITGKQMTGKYNIDFGSAQGITTSDELNGVIERIEAGTWTGTEADLIDLRSALTNSQQVVQQLAKFNVSLGEGRGIHIGDHTYYSWGEEALRALACMIHFGIQLSDGESLKSRVREKQAFYRNKIQEIKRKKDDRLSQLNSEYQDKLRQLESNHQDNLRKIETEHRNERDKEIEQRILYLTTKESEINQYINKQSQFLSEAEKQGRLPFDVHRGYAQRLTLARQDLVKVEREIEFLRQNRFRVASQGSAARLSVDRYFEGKRLELVNYLVSKKNILDSDLQRDQVKEEASAANEIRKIEKDGREEIYRFIIQFYLFKEGYPFSQNSLDELKQLKLEIEIRTDEIETVEESEIKPFYQKNLNKYKETFAEIINKEGYPLGKTTRTKLNQEQELLGLKYTDVNLAEKLIIKPFYQKNLNNYEKELLQIINVEGYPFSEISRKRLNQRQISLGLKCEDINFVEELIARHLYEENLNQYKNEFIDLISEKSDILTQESLAKFRTKQKKIGLKSKDIKAIERLIIKQFYQVNIDKYEKEFNQIVGKEKHFLDKDIKVQLNQRQQLLGIKLLGFSNKDIEIVKLLIKNSRDRHETIDYLSSDLFKEHYQKMRNLLASYYWKEANEETKSILFRLAGITKRDNLKLIEEKSIEQINVERMNSIEVLQLSIISTLWNVYSEGKFGFHKQRKLFDLVGRNYKAFSENVGWKERTFFLLDFLSWKCDNDIIFNIDAPEGHLPFWRPYIIEPEQFLMKF
ncbi:GUN4 domain-containing protein [Nostoc flagelliforme]|nr:GUN4 domain-containing protein [Nostoc flagelliforme]